MPIRIKPHHILKPCILTLKSIQGIIELVHQDFPTATYTALDECWEIYDESKDVFLDAISHRDKLDSLTIKGKTMSSSITREIELVFSNKEAIINCVAPPENENWFEHFMIDINKQILPPSFAQTMAYVYGKNSFYLSLPISLPIGTMQNSTPYCRIVIHTKPPNSFIENIKANLVSNIVWVVLGIGLTFLFQLMIKALGIQINLDWLGIR